MRTYLNSGGLVCKARARAVSEVKIPSPIKNLPRVSSKGQPLTSDGYNQSFRSSCSKTSMKTISLVNQGSSDARLNSTHSESTIQLR